MRQNQSQERMVNECPMFPLDIEHKDIRFVKIKDGDVIFNGEQGRSLLIFTLITILICLKPLYKQCFFNQASQPMINMNLMFLC